ncbi:MAG: hypothetical protein HC831_10080 [Chloroflexia bacterium]|nr:hypothetical protein [Chloroflexia bacterium]
MIKKVFGLSKVSDKQELESIIYSIIDSIPSALLITEKMMRYLVFNNTFIQFWQIPEEIIKTPEKEKIFAYLDTRIKTELFFEKTNDYLKGNRF